MKLRIDNEKIFFNGEILNSHFNISRSLGVSDELKDSFFNLRVDEIPNNIEIHYYSDLNKYNVLMNYDNDGFHMTVIYPVNPFDWGKNLSIKDYDKLVEEKFNKIDNVSITTELDEKDDITFNIFLTYIMCKDMILEDGLKHILNVYKKLEKEILSLKSLISLIHFKPEHLTAGSSILQYFGKILQEKYPNEKISVSIKQEGLKVTMIVETPDGKKEEIEEYLNKYGMVVMNQLSPEEFASNPIQLLELKQELRDAQNKIAFQQELLTLKDDTYKSRVLSLEDEVKFLREEFSAIRKSNDENLQVLLSTLLKKDKLINKLSKSIENKNQEETKQLLLELKEKDSKGYVSLKEHVDNIVAGNLTNAPSWLEFIVTHFPK